MDFATRLRPDEVIARLEAAHIKAVPTGIEHGTITAVADGQPAEVTTLRADVSTDGRRATVAFTDDWMADASRRDFKIGSIADSIAVMYKGKVVRFGPKSKVLNPPFDDYTDLLLKSVPEMELGWLEKALDSRKMEAAGH
jgi:tRNA nucleotidyltransferase/poly(A) polymerase